MPFFAETPTEIAEQKAYAIHARLSWKDVPLREELRNYLGDRLQTAANPPGFELYFVSKEPFPFGLYCGVRGVIVGEAITYLVMTLARKPNDKTPEWMQTVSDQLKGFPSGFAEFIEAVGNHAGDCSVDSELAFRAVDEPKLRSKIRPRSDIDPQGNRLIYEDLGFEHEDGTKISITLGPDTPEAFSVETTTSLVVDSHCFENACEAAWARLDPFLEKV